MIGTNGVATDIAKVDVGVRLDARQKVEKASVQSDHQDSPPGTVPVGARVVRFEKPDRRARCYRRQCNAPLKLDHQKAILVVGENQ